MIRKIGFLMPLFSLFLLPISGGAIPSLGVIDTDTLALPGGTTPVGMDGFLFPSDGRISVWWGSDSDNVDLDVHVWIATTAGSGATFAGYSLNTPITTNVAGYKLPIYAADLGSVNSNPLWDPATAPDLTTGQNMEFYVLGGVFGGSLASNDWIFAMADADKLNGVFQNGKDQFSPKTTSTTNGVVPEPATMLLLGFGLIGLAGYGRKKFFKK